MAITKKADPPKEYVILCQNHKYLFFSDFQCENKLCNKSFTTYEKARKLVNRFNKHKKTTDEKLVIALVSYEKYNHINIVSGNYSKRKRMNVAILENYQNDYRKYSY